MQITSVSRWLMIASIATAVLPVPRSPMISSRWPRPTFVIESIALTPVWSGSFTGWRSITPGAWNSSGRRSEDSIGPPPSSGVPSGSTTRPSSASPTGTSTTAPVRRTGSPSLTSCHSPKRATPTLSSSRLNAIPTTSCSNSSRSSETAFSSPWTRAIPSPTWSTVPTSERSVWTSYCSILDLRIDVISSGRSFNFSAPCHEVVSQTVEAAAHAAVEAVRADLEDDAADQRRVDRARRLDRAAGGLLDLLHDRSGLVVGELVRRRQLHGQAACLLGDQRVELPVDLRELGRPALLREEQDEVANELVCVREDLAQRRRAIVAVDLRVREQRPQLGHLVDGGGKLPQLRVDDVELAHLLGRLEERPGVHARGDCHYRLLR